ncbi:hypothetical protein D3C87_1793180 [compost metagenome]
MVAEADDERFAEGIERVVGDPLDVVVGAEPLLGARAGGQVCPEGGIGTVVGGIEP